MAIINNSFLISCLLTFLIIIIINPTLALKGFTTKLIHRESPLSPLSNPSLNQYQRLRNSVQRSISTSSIGNNIVSQVKPIRGEYLMRFSLGTPPVSQFGIVDTGSDLTWTQCHPCLRCYPQRLPIFDPSKSSTYKAQPCNTPSCQALDKTQLTCSSRNTCGYAYHYIDDSHTNGDLATETITFNSASFPISFGCSHDTNGTYARSISGIVGLGRGPLSLVSQLGPSIGGKFSYCLIPFAREAKFTSTFNFGTNVEVSGLGVVSLPMLKGVPETYYFLNLLSVSVGNSRIPFYKTSSTTTNGGNIIVDSGTTLTLLPDDMYSDFSSAVIDSIKSQLIDDPTYQYQLCYRSVKGGYDIGILDVTLHFEGGDLVLKPTNTFVQVTRDVVCLAIIPSFDVAILGNIAQTNFLVGFDTQLGKVSFKPTDCTRS